MVEAGDKIVVLLPCTTCAYVGLWSSREHELNLSSLFIVLVVRVLAVDSNVPYESADPLLPLLKDLTLFEVIAGSGNWKRILRDSFAPFFAPLLSDVVVYCLEFWQFDQYPPFSERFRPGWWDYKPYAGSLFQDCNSRFGNSLEFQDIGIVKHLVVFFHHSLECGWTGAFHKVGDEDPVFWLSELAIMGH